MLILTNVNILDRDIVFDARESFSSGFGKNLVISGADMSSSIHVANRKKGISITGKGQTKG